MLLFCLDHVYINPWSEWFLFTGKPGTAPYENRWMGICSPGHFSPRLHTEHWRRRRRGVVLASSASTPLLFIPVTRDRSQADHSLFPLAFQWTSWNTICYSLFVVILGGEKIAHWLLLQSMTAEVKDKKAAREHCAQTFSLKTKIDGLFASNLNGHLQMPLYFSSDGTILG